MKFVDLERQYQVLEHEIRGRIDAVMNHGRFIMGPEVGEVEERLSEFCGVRHTIGVANGTDAISLALMALEIGPGDAVFVPTFTFFATAEAVSLIGATPVFVDIDETTYNIDPAGVDAAIRAIAEAGELTPRAIIAVDLFGLPANYTELVKVAARHSVFLIEDAAQGLGGALHGKRSCSFGDVATTSFFPAKPLGCFGDGGAVFTSDDELADRLRSLRVHGQGRHKYDNVMIGMNSRLDTIQAAVLLAKLTIFDSELEARQSNADALGARLGPGFITPSVAGGYRSAWAQYSLRPATEDRDAVLARLGARDIPTAIYYAQPLHLAAAYKSLGYGVGDFPVSERVAGDVFSVPVHPYLDDNDLDRIAEALES